MTEKTKKPSQMEIIFLYFNENNNQTIKIHKAVFSGIAEINSCTGGIFNTPVFYLSLSLCVCSDFMTSYLAAQQHLYAFSSLRKLKR